MEANNKSKSQELMEIMEVADNSQPIPTTDFCEEFLAKDGLTIEELKEAYRELNDCCAGVGEEHAALMDEFDKVEKERSQLRDENGALKAELESLKKKYALHDYYERENTKLEKQVKALKGMLKNAAALIGLDD